MDTTDLLVISLVKGIQKVSWYFSRIAKRIWTQKNALWML